MSEKALRVFDKKYTSSFSEAQRTIAFSKSITARQDLEQAKKTFCLALTDWMENQVVFTDFDAFKLGMKFAPVLQGSKTKLVLTGLINEEIRCQVTFYHEDDNRLSWTTFSLSRPLFKKNSTRFGMQLSTIANYVHERMSPLGAGNRIIMQNAFSRSFKNFVKSYNKVHQIQSAKGSK